MQRYTSEERGKWMRRAAIASLCVGAVLGITKAGVWLVTGSVTMLASLTDSLLDFAASLITFIGVRTSLSPPDQEHRFGHGKAEGLAALAQSAIMLGSASFLFLESISRLFDPKAINQAWAGIAVSIFAIVLTLALVSFQNIAVKKSGSIAISADRLHYTGDLLLNLAVMAGIALSGFAKILWVDGLFGALIAIYIAYNAWQIAKSAIDMLMDREMSDATREIIIETIMQNANIRGVHDLKTRKAGLRDFIQFHIEVDAGLSLQDAHLTSLEVEAALSEQFSDADIIIKIDPLGSERPNMTANEIAEKEPLS